MTVRVVASAVHTHTGYMHAVTIESATQVPRTGFPELRRPPVASACSHCSESHLGAPLPKGHKHESPRRQQTLEVTLLASICQVELCKNTKFHMFCVTLQATGVFLMDFVNSTSISKDLSDVRSVLTTSTSCITGTGLKK